MLSRLSTASTMILSSRPDQGRTVDPLVIGTRGQTRDTDRGRHWTESAHTGQSY
jgi:hypothetical protein